MYRQRKVTLRTHSALKFEKAALVAFLKIVFGKKIFIIILSEINKEVLLLKVYTDRAKI